LGGIEDYSSMLRQQVEGRSDSWWIRWYLTVFRLGAFGLFPPKSLVTSIGLDRSATHGWLTARLLEVAKAPGLDELPAWPDPRAGVDAASFARFRRAMRPGVRRILRLGGKVKRALADRADRQRPRIAAAGIQLPDQPA
jgi:hypothetical protein